jgi:hypothetical protein
LRYSLDKKNHFYELSGRAHASQVTWVQSLPYPFLNKKVYEHRKIALKIIMMVIVKV